MRIAHTMLRVKNLDVSIDFYQNCLGMKILKRSEFEEGQFTLVFLGYEALDQAACLELTYNWDGRDYEQGSAYGHIALEVEDIYKVCQDLKAKNVEIPREPGPMKGSQTILAFIKDPDGYLIELIEKSD